MYFFDRLCNINTKKSLSNLLSTNNYSTDLHVRLSRWPCTFGVNIHDYSEESLNIISKILEYEFPILKEITTNIDYRDMRLNVRAQIDGEVWRASYEARRDL